MGWLFHPVSFNPSLISVIISSDITRVEIKRTIVQTYRERRFLSRSMRDVGQALRSLDHVLLFVAFIILFFISLSVFRVDIEKSLSSVYTLGIAASFIFKNTAKNIFDAIMFLFVTQYVIIVEALGV